MVGNLTVGEKLYLAKISTNQKRGNALSNDREREGGVDR